MLRHAEHGDAEAQKGQTNKIDDEISKHHAPPEIFQEIAEMPLKHFLMRVTGALRWLIPVRVSARARLRGARHRDFRFQRGLALCRDAIARHAAGGGFDPALLHHVRQRLLTGGQQMGRGKFRHGAELLQRGALDVVREVGGACWHVGVMQLRGH